MKQTSPIYSSKLSMINFYKEQLNTFQKVGIGRLTEHNTIVTDKLIDVTKRRLSQLSSTYEASLTPDAERFRIKRKSLLAIGEKQNA